MGFALILGPAREPITVLKSIEVFSIRNRERRHPRWHQTVLCGEAIPLIESAQAVVEQTCLGDDIDHGCSSGIGER
jgi:hypothetical protein